MKKLLRMMIVSGLTVTAGAGHLAAEPNSWAGNHLGLSAAYVQSKISHTDVNGNFDAAGIEYPTNDEAAAAFISFGHDWQTGELVIGAAADIGFLSAKASVNPGSPETNEITSELKSLASVRARLGLAQANSLIYLTGGIAFADIDSQSLYTGDAPLKTNGWRNGWVIGAGVEYALDENWTLSAEALQYGFKPTSDYFPGYGTTYREDLDISPRLVRIGLQYQF